MKKVLLECPECSGYGIVDQDKSWCCSKPTSACCGGCTEEVECIECNGTGEIEVDAYEHFENAICDFTTAIEELEPDEKVALLIEIIKTINI